RKFIDVDIKRARQKDNFGWHDGNTPPVILPKHSQKDLGEHPRLRQSTTCQNKLTGSLHGRRMRRDPGHAHSKIRLDGGTEITRPTIIESPPPIWLLLREEITHTLALSLRIDMPDEMTKQDVF